MITSPKAMNYELLTNQQNHQDIISGNELPYRVTLETKLSHPNKGRSAIHKCQEELGETGFDI